MASTVDEIKSSKAVASFSPSDSLDRQEKVFFFSRLQDFFTISKLLLQTEAYAVDKVVGFSTHTKAMPDTSEREREQKPCLALLGLARPLTAFVFFVCSVRRTRTKQLPCQVSQVKITGVSFWVWLHQ